MQTNLTNNNVLIENNGDGPTYLIFTGFGVTRTSFEFYNVSKAFSGKKIFVKEGERHTWYHFGISDKINTLDKLDERVEKEGQRKYMNIRYFYPSYITFDCHVYYCNNCIDDKKHIENIRSIGGINFHGIPCDSHKVAMHIKKRGMLKQCILSNFKWLKKIET